MMSTAKMLTLRDGPLDKFTLTENIEDRADFLKNLGLPQNGYYYMLPIVSA